MRSSKIVSFPEISLPRKRANPVHEFHAAFFALLVIHVIFFLEMLTVMVDSSNEWVGIALFLYDHQ